jgi:hypothetical protein
VVHTVAQLTIFVHCRIWPSVCLQELLYVGGSKQQGTNARHQFAHAERLGQTVISLELGADDPVHLFAPRG